MDSLQLNLQLQLYHLEQATDALVSQQLTHVTLLSVGVMAIAGLLTSLTPCMLSMLPITLGYIGGYASEASEATEAGLVQRQTLVQSLWFALGLATTLMLLGIAAVSLGQVYGQIGWGLPLLVSGVAILMGLNLLNVVPLRLPGVTLQVPEHWPHHWRSYGLGATFGLIASPCSTPVLATLLAWVASSHNLWTGAVLLLAYAIGYVSPLVLAGAFVGALKRLLALRQWSGWINSASGVLLLGFGVFSLLSRLFPVVS